LPKYWAKRLQRQGVTARHENEVSLENEYSTNQIEVSKASNMVSKRVEAKVEILEENDDFVRKNSSTCLDGKSLPQRKISSQQRPESKSSQPNYGGSAQLRNKYSSSKSLLITNTLRSTNHLKCQKCGMKFNCKSQLKMHFLSHKDKSTWPYACQLCKEKAQSKFNLYRHYMTKIHRDDPRFEQ